MMSPNHSSDKVLYCVPLIFIHANNMEIWFYSPTSDPAFIPAVKSPERNNIEKKNNGIKTNCHKPSSGNSLERSIFHLASLKIKAVLMHPKPYWMLLFKLIEDASGKYLVGQLTSATV